MSDEAPRLEHRACQVRLNHATEPYPGGPLQWPVGLDPMLIFAPVVSKAFFADNQTAPVVYT